MKKIYGFAALCAAMTLASCSNNDEPVVNPVNGGEKVTATGYLSVNIAKAGSTRAQSATIGYEDGTEKESLASSATFVFFTDADKYVTTVENQPLGAFKAPVSDNIERDYSAMVKIPLTIDATEYVYEDGVDPDKATPEQKKTAEEAGIKAKIASIKKVVAILNAETTINSKVNTDAGIQDVDDVLAVVADYASSTYTSDYGFVMTNSVHWDTSGGATKLVYAQPVTTTLNGETVSSVAGNEADAASHPIDLYVERVVARVDAHFDNAFKSNFVAGDEENKPKTGATVNIGSYNPTTKTVSYTRKNLDIKITGIEVANAANTAFLVKNLNSTYDASNPFSNWNDSNKKRSHWAVSKAKFDPSKALGGAYTANDYANVAYENEDDDDTTPTFNNKFVYEQDAEGNYPTFQKYVNENTSETTHTALIVSAQLVETGTNKAVEFVRIRKNGQYYDPTSAKAILINYIGTKGYAVKEIIKEAGKADVTKYRNLDLDEVEFVSFGQKGYNGSLQLTEDFKDDANLSIVQTTDGQNYTAVADFDAVLSSDRELEVWQWKDGKCYYYVNLTSGDMVDKEVTDAEGKTTTTEEYVYGVVRNHIYDLNLKSMVGLGVPVFDPFEIIIPTDPEKLTPDDDDWSLACDIHILSWARYTQDVEFNNGSDY